MKTIAFIPMKLNNERLPGKNVKRFDDGTPLADVMFRKLASLYKQELDEIYVYCSDPSIKEYLPPEIRFLKRPEELDGKNVHGTEIYRAFVKEKDADIYVLCHVTSPFIETEHIARCIGAVKSGKYDSAFCAKKIQNFLWKDNKPFNFILNQPPRTQDMEPIFMEQSTPYVFTKEVFRQYGARTGITPFICECVETECVDIDYPEDFELANMIYMNKLGRKS